MHHHVLSLLCGLHLPQAIYKVPAPICTYTDYRVGALFRGDSIVVCGFVFGPLRYQTSLIFSNGQHVEIGHFDDFGSVSGAERDYQGCEFVCSKGMVVDAMSASILVDSPNLRLWS